MPTQKQEVLFTGFFCVVSLAFAVHSILTFYLIPACAWYAMFTYSFIIIMYEDTLPKNESTTKAQTQPTESGN